jgi:ABC-2 type transport system permease protein
MISANAVNSVKAALGSSYLSAILADYFVEVSGESAAIVPQYRFNPGLDYKVFMVPALMVMLLTLLCGFLPALNIVAEKEAGTIEQINVSPVPRRVFILAKLIPWWVVGFVVLGVCMVLAGLVYGLWPAGSVGTIFLGAGIYILVVSGVGLVISNYSDTMQQAMFVMFFFILVLLLISGLFTPVRSMPGWAQAIAAVNPLKYFIEVMRMVYLKGSGLAQLGWQLAALAGFAVAFNSWAVASYRKNN